MLRLSAYSTVILCLGLPGCDAGSEEVTATVTESATESVGTTSVDTEGAGSTADTEGSTTVDEGSTTVDEGSTTVDEGSTTVDEGSTTMDESSTGGLEVACGWRVSSSDAELPGGVGTFPVALATCSEESGVRLKFLSDGGASCEDPNATPGCDDAYEGITLTLAPEQLEAGTYDVAELVSWVDLQGGGGGKVDCNYIGTGADGGELIISSVTETEITGYVSAAVNLGPGDSDFVSGRFTASLCGDPGS
ncbi:MAG: hypothetical protein ACRBN8_44535 [Nannocystales bacterium]